MSLSSVRSILAFLTSFMLLSCNENGSINSAATSGPSTMEGDVVGCWSPARVQLTFYASGDGAVEYDTTYSYDDLLPPGVKEAHVVISRDTLAEYLRRDSCFESYAQPIAMDDADITLSADPILLGTNYGGLAKDYRIHVVNDTLRFSTHVVPDSVGQYSRFRLMVSTVFCEYRSSSHAPADWPSEPCSGP